jgi:hypothetical protein
VRARERGGERDAGDADEHEPVLEQVRPHDGELPAERRVGGEHRRREDDRRHGLQPECRRQHDLRGLRQEREPDDLRGEHQEGGDAAGREAVIASDDLGERDRALAPDPPGQEEPEEQEPDRAREVEPDSG